MGRRTLIALVTLAVLAAVALGCAWGGASSHGVTPIILIAVAIWAILLDWIPSRRALARNRHRRRDR